MLNRRNFIAVVAAGTLPISSALADEDQVDFSHDLVFPPIDPFTPYGYSEPSQEERDAAASVLQAAPTGPSPHAVARWFAEKPDKRYIRQWAADDHWNPVIVEFFRKGTDLRASNDMINWCAAFVNFCFVQTGTAGTLDPSSQSFLPNYYPKVPGSGNFIKSPKPKMGDVAVFTCHRLDNDQSIGLGHVGFLDGPYDPQSPTVPLLAGNTAGNGTYSSISSKAFPVELKMSRSLGNGARLPVKLKLNTIVSIG